MTVLAYKQDSNPGWICYYIFLIMFNFFFYFKNINIKAFFFGPLTISWPLNEVCAVPEPATLPTAPGTRSAL